MSIIHMSLKTSSKPIEDWTYVFEQMKKMHVMVRIIEINRLPDYVDLK